MERTIQIDGKDVLLRCTAKTPIIYNALIHRDLLIDFDKLQKNKTEDGGVDIGSLETFLNIAYVMAWQGEDAHHRERMADFPKTPGDWLDQFEMFSVYEHLDTIMNLMLGDRMTLVKEKNL